MASTTFIDGQTVIYASWLNDVNTAVYTGVFPNGNLSLTNLTVSGTVTGAGFTSVVNANLLSPGPIGSTTPNTGKFTTLNATSATLTGALNANSAVLTNALPISSGGTGLTSVGTSGYPLASTGSGLQYRKLGLGITGETWNDVSSSRSLGTTYTNSNSYPILVNVTISDTVVNQVHYFTVNGLVVASTYVGSNLNSENMFMSAIVPPGKTYIVSVASGGSISTWCELY